MHLHIRHQTTYRYERPIKYSVQSLHLTPRRDINQRLLSWRIATPGRQLEQIDAHGNVSHLLTIEEPHRENLISVTGIVETAESEAGAQYCRLAVGRDYLDAAPVRGVRQGSGGESMRATVLVAISAQQQ